MPQDPEIASDQRKALVSLGSNATSPAGGPVETVRAALDALGDGPCQITARSPLYVTPFLPRGDEPDVINAVVEVIPSVPPRAFLAFLHNLEAQFARSRTARWSNRTLDLDLLTLDQIILPDQSTLREWVNLPESKQKISAPDQLILPHPRLQDRPFVLVPAADIAPDWRHPLLNLTIAQMLAALPQDDVAEVRRLAP